jgi:hypothetical protein
MSDCRANGRIGEDAHVETFGMHQRLPGYLRTIGKSGGWENNQGEGGSESPVHTGIHL